MYVTMILNYNLYTRTTLALYAAFPTYFLTNQPD